MSLSQITCKIIGKRVKATRQKIGLSQIELAATLCVDYGTNLERVQISTIERGVRSVKDKELDALAKILGVTPKKKVWVREDCTLAEVERYSSASPLKMSGSFRRSCSTFAIRMRKRN